MYQQSIMYYVHITNQKIFFNYEKFLTTIILNYTYYKKENKL